MKKILFIASTGGHLFELLELKDIFDKYNYYIVTEKTPMTLELKNNYDKKRVFFLLFGARENYFVLLFALKFIYNFIYSFFIFLKVRPKYIVTTGSHTAVPMCFIGKLFNAKIVFIETRANFSTKTLSGKLIYPIADLFIIQHEGLSSLYPHATLCQYY
jgi:UDP-N-acetylglucosamine:LPS N-acetylglucosamine transferase